MYVCVYVYVASHEQASGVLMFVAEPDCAIADAAFASLRDLVKPEVV